MYGRGLVDFSENRGGTWGATSYEWTTTTTFSYTTSACLDAQVHAIISSVKSSLGIVMLASLRDVQNRRVTVRSAPYHVGVIQDAEPFENVSGTLTLYAPVAGACRSVQSDPASLSAPLPGFVGYLTSESATSPLPPWPQK